MRKIISIQWAVLIVLVVQSVWSQGYEWAGTISGDGEQIVRGLHIDANDFIYTTGYYS